VRGKCGGNILLSSTGKNNFNHEIWNGKSGASCAVNESVISFDFLDL
jgi:hypothetical protein